MTKIQWTDKTWNPIVGCSVSTPGCTNCYAMKIAVRLGSMPNMPRYHGLTKKVNGNAVWTGEMRMVESALMQPLKRKKPTMYFVNSMGDLFHENVPDEWIDRVFAVMALCPQHTFQVLTKRADRMREYMEAFHNEGYRLVAAWGKIGQRGGVVWPMPNVWLGVSVEDQKRWSERWHDLARTPAAIRFISAEPLLGPIDMVGSGKLDWLICGGESGPKARPMHPDWARSLRDQCAAVGVPFFFKQWGSFSPLIDRDNDDPDWRRNYGVAAQKPKQYKILNLEAGTGFHGERVHLMGRIPKAAGNLLDGKEWRQMPEVRE